jgi:hypothetical protein
VYLLSVDSLKVVQLGIALTDGGFTSRTLNVFIVFSKPGEKPAGRAF